MITVKDVRLYIDRMVKREAVGNTISGSDFNRFLKVANAKEIDNLKRKVEASQDITDSLRHLYQKTDYFATSGLIPIPDDYLKLQSLERFNGTKYVEADVVTVMEYRERINNSITAPTSEDPIAYIESNTIRLFPQDNAGARYVYLKKPSTPYLDWYIDTAGNVIHMDEGDVVSAMMIDSDYRNYGNDGLPLDLDGGNYISKTVEFDWLDDGVIVNIINRMLLMAGIVTPSPLNVEVSANDVNKQEVQI